VGRITQYGRSRIAVLVTAACACVAPHALAEEGRILRVFLRDGTSVACYGEYARVDGRIVMSLPLGEQKAGVPRLQLVSLPAGKVDWDRTERYRDSARAAQYAGTRGEHDFMALTSYVAQALSEIARTTDSGRQLQLAEAARRRLSGWGPEHYGYRVREVREIAALLDETISELRAAAGQNEFDFSLVAIVEPPPPDILSPPPTAAESIAQALTLVDYTDIPAERIALLEQTLALMDASAGRVNRSALKSARKVVEKRLGQERVADEQYGRFFREITGLADTRAARADVRGVEALLATVERRDHELGRLRPQLVSNLASTVRRRLDDARELRLELDRWEQRLPVYRSYERLVRASLSELALAREPLEDIRRLAGPDAGSLVSAGERLERVTREIDRVVPPRGAAQIHELLQSACRMAQTAVRVRQEAVDAGSIERAWSASAAAAGSQLLLTRARDELGRLFARPRLR
jgi:hypothetical protein